VMPDANTAILFQAEAAGNNAEIKQLVLKDGAPTPDVPKPEVSTAAESEAPTT
jgi:hypothetical protein